MYTAKHTMLYKHKVHEGQAHVFYMDIARAARVRRVCATRHRARRRQILSRRVSKITQNNGQTDRARADTLSGVPVTVEADLVCWLRRCAVRRVAELAQKLNVGCDESAS